MNLSSTLILTAAVTPAIVLLAYILIRDRHHPEPAKQIAKGFGFGCISVAIVLTLIGIPNELGLFEFDLPAVSNSIANAFFLAAFPEEAAKMFMLWLLLRKNPFFDERMDGIVYAVCVGMGFAATENILYLYSNLDSLISVSVGRAFLAIPEHFCVAVIMGYFFAIAFFNPNKRWYYALAYLVPVAFHGLYDACLMVNEVPTVGISILAVALFVGGFVSAILFSQKAIRAHLKADESQPIVIEPGMTSVVTPPTPPAFIEHLNPEWEITFPFNDCERMTLKETVTTILKIGYTYMIRDTILYNIPLRNAYRDMGAEAFTQELLAMVDNNESLAKRMQEFNEYIVEHGGIADYDIQVYNINETITLFGVSIYGLKGLEQRVECACRDEKNEHPYPKEALLHDIHVGKIWHSYPIFDSYDLADDRTYDNYIVRDHEITAEEMEAIINLPSGSNYIRITKQLSTDCLPLVYYEGNGNKLIVATAKKPIESYSNEVAPDDRA